MGSLKAMSVLQGPFTLHESLALDRALRQDYDGISNEINTFMDSIFSIVKFMFFGFFGLIGALFVLALIFGKRVVKQWEYEAEFRDENGREFGEFDIELSHIAKEETVDTFKAEFKLRHATLSVGQRVQVFLDETLVIEGTVEKAGRIRLGNNDVVTSLDKASAGQICRVVYGGVEQFTQAIVRD